MIDRQKLLIDIINSTPDFIFVKDTKLRTVLCNKAYAAAVCKEPEELIGKTDIENGWNPELVHGNPLKGIRGFENDDRDVLTGKTIHNPYDPANTGGRILIYDTYKIPLYNESKQIIGVLGISRDVTERKRMETELTKHRDHLDELVKEKTKALRESENALKESEAKFKTIFNDSRDGLLLGDLQTRRFYMCNKAICEMLGYTEEELMRLSVKDIHPEKDLPYVIEQFDKQARGELRLAPDLPVKRKDGSVFYADINSSPIKLAGKIYLLGSFRDITQRKKMEQELETQAWGLAKANEGIKVLYKELEGALKVKAEFTSTVSHELRTPLAAIKEGISIVIDKITGEINDEQKKYLGIAKKNVDRLDRLINGILDFQKLKAGKMEFRTEENDINEVVKEIGNTMVTLTDKKNIELIVEIAEDLPKIKFDRDKIVQVLTNLMNNAIKFTEEGNIAIVTSRGGNFIQVTVKDTGQGIKKEDMPKLFQQFTQLQRKVSGTGLGLAICKEIIDAHNGKMWAESPPAGEAGEFGKGTAFHFILPIIERSGSYGKEDSRR